MQANSFDYQLFSVHDGEVTVRGEKGGSDV